jgi:hypothetical protein
MKPKTIKNLLTCLACLICCVTHAQTKINNDTTLQRKLYKTAYLEINEMLTDKKPLSLKRAIFIIENAFVGGTMNYQNYDDSIKAIGRTLNKMIRDKNLQQFKTSGNWAAFTYMTDTIAYNNFKPYSYDFKDFFGDSSWTSQFVTKLMQTKIGNCHSLPLFYKVICDEIGAKSSIAFAPSHLYIKHKDENGKWVNLEMTNGSFARDEWIMQQNEITIDQIKSGIYMNATTEKELIAFMLFDLQSCYHRTFKCDAFNSEIIETGLKYFPNCINLQLAKAYHYQQILLNEKKKGMKGNLFAKELCIKKLKELNLVFDKLGYKDETKEHYTEWIKSVELEKSKRNIK